jgi:hypothetical protein
VRVYVSERGAFLASAFDAATAIQMRIETWMPGAFSTPPHTTDLEHSVLFYFRVSAALEQARVSYSGLRRVAQRL